MRRSITFISVQIISLLLFGISFVLAWTGESSFGPESREEMKRIALEMTDFSWSPTANYSPWGYTFNGGQIYKGEAYTQQTPMENWSEFYSCFDNPSTNDYISGCGLNPQDLGNDCSGFVSMSWKLPQRYDTSLFESDSTNSGGYVTKLGDIGSGQSVNLLAGDGMVKVGHIALFESYQYNQYGQTIGINTWEQMCDLPNFGRCWADRITNSSNRLWPMSSYRPIRRNNILDYVFQAKWGSLGYYNPANGQFYNPEGIAVDSSGNVYVADTENQRIQKFTSNGTFITKWGSYGTGNGQFDKPTGIAVNSGGNVYVVDSGNNRIQIFDGNGMYITKWGTYGCLANGQLCYPYGIAVDSSSNVYITEPSIDRIQKFTSSGNYLIKINSSGSGNGQFNSPRGIAVDSSGYVYVVDRGNYRIQKFDRYFNYVTQWGSSGSGDGQFYTPYGIAADSTGNVYVTDSLTDRVQKFGSDGKYITQWGSYGSGDSQFGWVVGIALDSSGRVYVTDTGNDRIQKFSPFPLSPSNLTATATSSQISLSWQDNSNSETGFQVKRKTEVRGAYETIATLGAGVTTFADTNIAAGNTYYYSVWSYNGVGESAYSNEVQVASYSLNVSKSGTGNGNVVGTGIDCGTDCTEFYMSGTSVNLTAMAAADSTFTGWSGSCTGTGVCSLTMNGNNSVTAEFKENPKIMATAGIGGYISPSGPVMVSYNGNQTFNITPSTGYYYIFDVKVDGISQGNISSYTFSNVISDHIIEASFAIYSFTISSEVSGGIGGTITPASATLNYGESQTFTIAPEPGYHVVNAEVDGVSKGAISSYTFTNLAASHLIKVTFSNTYALTVSKTGIGNGTISSSPSGISCGATCSSSFSTGTVVTLTASPSSDSSMTGWSGGSCSGTGNCVVTLNAATAINATFNILPPVTNFTAYPITGYTPPALAVNFTDTSTNSPISWSWNFGDSGTSTLKNPSHAYTSAGTYTVTLTATNASGSNTITKSNIITVQACPNLPVRIVRGGTPVYFSTINSAYSSAVDGETIQAQAVTFAEGLSSYKTITLDGGYDCTYTSKAGYTTLQGNQVNISGGTATIKDVVIE